MTATESRTESFETGDVAREFEDSEDSQDSENLSCFGNVLKRVLRREFVENLRDKERKDSKKVDDVEERKKKFDLQTVLILAFD